MGKMKDIRLGLKANLIAGLGMDDQQISAYALSNPHPPSLIIRPAPDGTIEYHQTMGAAALEFWMFEVVAYVGGVDDISAQQNLDEMVEPTGSLSVMQALELDKTLGGVAQDVVVTHCTGYREYVTAEGTAMLGATWAVEVYPIGG